ncbi:MAG: sigma-70 family RNA polymerase sigma factor, partial [Planctomycetes bacterium]|nr:sigma-70 family RNA polymerase sigma factor [Planctomycetota bacterium]
MARGKETTFMGQGSRFPDTIWSIILQAKESGSENYMKYMSVLASMYWRPVYKYIRVIWNKSVEDAKDLTQEFFTNILEKDYLKNISPENGRFRTYVIISLKHFLINMKDKRTAKKRGGDSITLSIEASDTDIAANNRSISNPELFFDQEWAQTVISRSLRILKDDLES